MARKLTKEGEFKYDLVIETKGKRGRMYENGQYVTGVRRILKNAANENRIQAIVNAFNRLRIKL